MALDRMSWKFFNPKIWECPDTTFLAIFPYLKFYITELTDYKRVCLFGLWAGLRWNKILTTLKETAALASFLQLGQPRVTSHWQEVWRERSILNAVEYVRFQNILKVGWDAVEYVWWLSLGGCSGVCVVDIIRYRCF